MGVAIFSEANLLLVPSSNFDLRYSAGQLHLMDLVAIQEKIGDAASPSSIAVSDVMLDHMPISSFASDPVILSPTDAILGWVHRRSRGIYGAQIADDSLTCLNQGDEGCGPITEVELMAENPARPFSNGAYLWVPHLADDQLTIFQAQDDVKEWAHLTTIELDPLLATVRLGTYTQSTLNRPRLWLTGQQIQTNQVEAVLVWGLAPQDGQLEFEAEGTLNLTQLTGSSSINDLAWFDDGQSLAVALRNPDGLALLSSTQRETNTPALQLKALEGSCNDPTRLLAFVIDDENYLALTCLNDDVFRIYRGDDLTLVAVQKNDGQGPRNLSWDATNNQLWVSYFKSHSLAVYQLKHGETGAFEMALVAQVGAPLSADEETE